MNSTKNPTMRRSDCVEHETIDTTQLDLIFDTDTEVDARDERSAPTDRQTDRQLSGSLVILASMNSS